MSQLCDVVEGCNVIEAVLAEYESGNFLRLLIVLFRFFEVAAFSDGNCDFTGAGLTAILDYLYRMAKLFFRFSPLGTRTHDVGCHPNTKPSNTFV